jgi:hypothetical protein
MARRDDQDALQRARAAVPGGDGPSSAEVEATAAQLAELREVLAAVARPSVIGGLRSILAAGGHSAAALDSLSAQIDALQCPAIGLEFKVRAVGVPSLFVFLAGCPAGHPTSDHLRRLRDSLSDSEWDRARKQMGALLLYAREAFRSFCLENAAFVASLSGRAPGSDCSDLHKLQVDPLSTTLYIKPDWALRVGFYVLDGEEALPA